jgi:hypothetical protein
LKFGYNLPKKGQKGEKNFSFSHARSEQQLCAYAGANTAGGGT